MDMEKPVLHHLSKYRMTGIRLRNVSAQLEDIHMENIGDAGLDCQGSLFKTVTLVDSKLECSQYGVIFMGNSNTDLNMLSNDVIQSSGSTSDPQYGLLLANNNKGIFSSISVEDNLIDMPNPIASLYSLEQHIRQAGRKYHLWR